MPALIVQKMIRRRRVRLSSSSSPGKPGQPVQGGGVHSESAAAGTASLSFQRFTRWKTLNLSTVLALLPFLLTGCVIFPHGDLQAPPANGTVLDSQTHQPIPQAKVIRRIPRLDRTSVMCTDQHGEFSFKRDKDLGWLLMVDYAPNRIQYRIEAAGYVPFETNRYGGGSFYRGTLPHDFGVVLLEKQ